MAHSLQGLIAKVSLLHKIAANYENALVITLKEQEYGFLPLSFPLLEELKSEAEYLYPKLVRLEKKVVDLVEQHSHSAPIAYIQTEYFGGIGEQGAIVWHNGKVVFGPEIVWGIGPINSALRAIGVKVTDEYDEFDTLGLGQWRNMYDWDGYE